MVLLRKSQRDGRKDGKLQPRWLGPYIVQSQLVKVFTSTESFNWKGTQESSECVPTEAILFEKKSGFSFLRFISIPDL